MGAPNWLVGVLKCFWNLRHKCLAHEPRRVGVASGGSRIGRGLVPEVLAFWPNLRQALALAAPRELELHHAICLARGPERRRAGSYGGAFNDMIVKYVRFDRLRTCWAPCVPRPRVPKGPRSPEAAPERKSDDFNGGARGACGLAEPPRGARVGRAPANLASLCVLLDPRARAAPTVILRRTVSRYYIERRSL